MLEEYKQLKENLVEISTKLSETRISLDEHLDSKSKMERYLNELKEQVNSEIEANIEKMKDEKRKSVEESYVDYYTELTAYKQTINKEFVKVNLYIQNCQFLDNSDFNLKVSKMQGIIDKIEVYTLKLTSKSLINIYARQGYGLELSERSIEDFSKWLDYFNDYDKYDQMLGTVSKMETKMWKKFDSTYILLGIVLAVSLIFLYPLYTSFPYLILVLGTLYLRIHEYYILLELLGVYSFMKNEKERLKNINAEEIKKYAEYYTRLASESYQKHMDKLNEITMGIEEAKIEACEQALMNFDYESARETAEQMVKNDSDQIQERVKEEEKSIEELSIKLQELDEKYTDISEQLINLRRSIKETYENLIPSFSSNKMLENFFLGFKDDEPTFFNYDGEPCVIFYSAKSDETKAIMLTIKMMCGQIMTTMNPLAYQINVIDMLTGGAALSPFQVTSANEDKLQESKLFRVISSSESCKDLMKELFNQYNARRVKVLGTYPSIKEYNEYKESVMARTLPYLISFFYEYDYGLLISDESLQQLCRISKMIGYCFFFMVNVDNFEPKKLSEEKKSTLSHTYRYRYDDLLKILSLFKDSNVYSFKFTGNDVDIVQTERETILGRIKE